MKKRSTNKHAHRSQKESELFLPESLKYVRSITKRRPKIAVILGSGLGDFTNTLADRTLIKVSSIPNYPRQTVQGHSGIMVFGSINGVTILALQGRFHFYESGNLESVLYPIRVTGALGVSTLILTNAAGGINPDFRSGDLMLISDQINLTFEHPSTDFVVPERRTSPYDQEMNNAVARTAAELGITLRHGVYCGVKGPSYETAAEIEMIRRIGGDAVGMSTVNEASLATRLGMRVIGISCITNMATGIAEGRLSHAEVTEVANKVKLEFASLLASIIKDISSM